MAEENKVLVTSALPYANGSIHVGHLVEYIQTDVFVRFLKLIGKKAIYCCADDTHGAPIEINARKQGIKPEQLIAKYFTEHQRDFKNFLIEFDNYYTTNSPENKKYSDLIFTRLKEKGYIYQKDVEQTYCEHCKRFLPDRYVKGKCPKCGAEDQYGDVCEKCNSAYKTTDLVEPYCTICSNPPVRKTSKHYFFKLSDFSEKLRKYITGNKNLQEEVKNHVLKWVNDGLEDWCISRDGPYFGFLIPGETDKYYYVWLDAPIGYIASAQNYCDKHNENVDDYWKNGEIIHFIGKDIIYFHLLFWPAMLMGAEFTLPSNIVVHGFLTVNKEKMSKSRGTLFTAEEFLDIAEPELLRFYYAANLTHSLSDIDLDLHDFAERVNSELVSNIANFFYRVLSFANKNFDSKLSTVEDEAFVKQTLPYFDKIKEYYQTFEFREAVKAILQVSSLGNKYFQDNEPWKLIKDDREKAHKVITLCANLVKNINISLKPIMPAFTKKIEEQLNLKGLSWKDIDFKTENHSIGGAGIILQKIAETKKEEKTATRVSPADFKEVKLAVDPAVKKLGIAAVSACISGITVRKKSEQVEALKEQYLSEIDFKENILSEYERLYDQLGVKQTSPIRLMIESLKEDRKFPNVNTVVDLYNAVSAKYNVSMGCHDLNKLQGTPKLIMTRGDEKFVPLGETKEEDVKQGIFSCVVDENVICYLDVKQGEKTKIGESTENIFIYAQGNKETSVEYLEKALSEACENIKLCCAGAKSHGFEILNLKIAEIKDVEEHPDADKLYVLKISIGSESKQLVAGLRQHYTKEELLGKKIIVVTNLKKAKLKGIDSQGMLLAGVEGENVGLLTAEKSNSGEQVFVEGENKFSIKEIEFSDFQKIKLEVKEGKPVFENKVLKTASEEITVEKVKNGTVM